MTDSSADRDPLDRLAEEFVARYRRGERPSLTEYADRLPNRADEVRDLFAALVEMEQLKPVTADHTGAYVPAVEPTDPERIGEFRILRLVGRGGMGVVYEAVQESLGRHVALKILPIDALTDARRLERFRREAKAAARLHHTNIVPVFGVGEADGRHYYAMQFIAGHPLDAVIDEVRRVKDRSAAPIPRDVSEVAAALLTGTFATNQNSAGDVRERPEFATTTAAYVPGSSADSAPGLSGSISDGGRHFTATVARIGAQVADALAYAHAQGILHRDIKPANLLLDLQGTVWVTDFGLAKSNDTDDLTHGGDVVGTLRYMAPERFDGPGDERSDVYALGLTLYELLTLRPAFVAENRARLVQEVTAAAPPPPRSVNPAIPRDLETIVLKALVRDPAMRYQSASELADDLRLYLEDRPIRARRASSAELAWRWCRRNRVVAGLIILVLWVSFTGTVVSSMFAVRADRQATRANENALDAFAREKEADEARREAWTQAAIAGENARLAKAKGDDADRAGGEARAAAASFKRQLYFNQIPLAQQYWRADDGGQADKLLVATPPELRGWEWSYLERLQRSELLSLPGNGQFTTNLSLSADGMRMAALAETGNAGVRVWDLTTNKPLTEIVSSDTGRSFFAGTLSPDGQTVATGERSGTVALWDAATGKLVKELGKLSGSVASVSVSPDGTKILAATSHSAPKPDWRMWDLATGDHVPSPAGVPHASMFAPGGRLFGFKKNPAVFRRSSVQDYLGVLYGLATGAEERVVGSVGSWAFTSDGKRMAVGGWDDNARPQLRVFDLSDGTPVMTATVSQLGDVAFSPDGKLLAAAHRFERPIEVWEVAGGQKVRTLRGHRHFVNAVTFCPDGRLVSCSWDNTIRFWDATADQEVVRLPGRGAEAPSAAAIHPLGTEVAFVQGDRLGTTFPGKVVFGDPSAPVYLREPTGGKAARRLSGHESATRRVTYAAGGTSLISGDQHGRVIAWNAANGASLGSVRHDGSVEAVALSPDGRWAVSSHEPRTVTLARIGRGKFPDPPIGGVVRVWDAVTGAERFRLDGHRSTVYAVAFSSDGTTIATASHGQLRLWDSGRGELRREVTDKEIDSLGLTFDPTGRSVATASQDAVRLWDTATGARLAELPGQGGIRFGAMAFTRDGSRVVTAFGRVVRLWDSATGQEILTLPVPGEERVLALGFTSDGYRLLAAMYDGGVLAWDARPATK